MAHLPDEQESNGVIASGDSEGPCQCLSPAVSRLLAKASSGIAFDRHGFALRWRFFDGG
jgi:hypothetical protein